MGKKRIKNLYAQHDVDWHLDARCQKLGTAHAKWANYVLWNLCVKNKTDTLPDYMDDHYLAAQVGSDVRTFRRDVAIMEHGTNKLVTRNSDDTITVHGVADIHETANFPFLRRKPLAACNISPARHQHATSTTPTNFDTNKTKQSKTKQNKIKNLDIFIKDISKFYQVNINSKGLSDGRRNLTNLLNKKTITPEQALKYAENYAGTMKIEGKSPNAPYTYQMNNFFGKKAVYQDFVEPLNLTPVNDSQALIGFHDWPDED